MKQRLFCILLSLVWLPLSAQIYQPGEILEYRVSYKAKLFPNTEMATVKVETSSVVDSLGRTRYKLVGSGRTMPRYRIFYNLEDVYTVMVDPETLLPLSFASNLRESDYTFRSMMTYDWDSLRVHSHWQSRKRAPKEHLMDITRESLDALSLYFRMRSAHADDFEVGKVCALPMILQDTIRPIHYRYLGRDVKKVRNMGKFRALKFECELGSTEGFSFTDGTVFTLWISDDENKIPLYIESPVRVGSIQAYISRYRGLKYPMKSKIR